MTIDESEIAQSEAVHGDTFARFWMLTGSLTLDGVKMSKSLGNSPDLLDLVDRYGADAVRFGIMVSSPAGNDLMFDEAALEQGRNFNNKIWNALKLVKMWQERQTTDNRQQTTANFEIKEITEQETHSYFKIIAIKATKKGGHHVRNNN